MPILTGDIKLLASKVMDDVPEGGGGPTGTAIADGASNAMFADVTEVNRAGGSVSIRQLFLAVQTADRDSYMDANIIVAEPPNDPNVSITLAKCDMFARRTDIANAIGNYLIAGPPWSGYLFENHVKDQRNLQLFQRPNTPLPPVNRTLLLIQDEGLPSEKWQYVRTTRVSSTERLFYDPATNADYLAQVVECELSDVLRSAFKGSPASRNFTKSATGTLTRDTTVADAGAYSGVVPLTVFASMGDSSVKAASIYTQLVPSSRTESIALDQRPAAQRTLELATAPRPITLSVAPHTMRVRVGQENRGFAWVQILTPPPAPNTVVVSYRALGAWYSLSDDGLGEFTGSGVGTVNYANGSIAITLPVLPDAGSSIIYSWGEKAGLTNRAGQAGYRPPEYAFAVAHLNIKPGTLVVTWTSAGVIKTATDSGTGTFTGDATGEINYVAGKYRMNLSAMIDAGGEFSVSYKYVTSVTKSIPGVVPDAGGFATIALDDVPAKGSILLTWFTVRNVSNSSGGNTGSVVKSDTAVLGKIPQAVNTQYSAARPADQTPYARASVSNGT